MDRDAITVLLIARTPEHTGIGSSEVYVSNADALYEELLAKGAKTQGPPVSRPWDLRDFRVIDLEGNRITFAQAFEMKRWGSTFVDYGPRIQSAPQCHTTSCVMCEVRSHFSGSGDYEFDILTRNHEEVAGCKYPLAIAPI